MLRPDLSSLLVDETIRRWLPEEDLPAQAFALPRPSNDAELHAFFRNTLGINFPTVAVCPNHVAPFTAIADAFFARSTASLWIASRGFGGKTFAMGALAFAEAVTLRASVSLLGGSGEQATRVHEYLREFWAKPNAPKNLLIGDASKQRTALIWGNKVTALMASMAAVSGPHPQRLRIDECLGGDTRIATPRGYIKIRDIAAGDIVYNGDGKAVSVRAAVSKGRRRVLSIGLSTGITIKATPEHLFRIVDYSTTPATERWVEARYLTPDTFGACVSLKHFVGGDGEVIVVAVPEKYSVDEVFDLTIPDGHTFIAEGVVVHNCDLVDLKLVDQALGQPMSKDGVKAHVLFSSARYEPDGTLAEIEKRAKDKGWIRQEWCWKETLQPHGWISQEEIDLKQNLVTAEMWKTQYDNQEPNPAGLAIDREMVERMFFGPAIESEAGDGAFFYREFEQPVNGASYSTGGDWARTSDYVEIVTLRTDVSPMRLVAYQRFRRKATQYTLAQFETQNGRYPGTAAHDATSLGGKMMSDLIDVDETTEIEGVTMVGRVRRELFTDCVLAIEHGELRSPRIAVFYRQLKFVTNADLWGAGHPPDGFVALSMAYRAASHEPLRVVGSDTPSPTRMREEFQGAMDFLRRPQNGNGHG